jgi:ATP-dependent DNA helicase RecQ
LAIEGICVVVSPLIALMKDQVENLNKRGVKAVGVYHGMSKMEIDVAIDNCVYGDIKFLYLSPERLKTDIVKQRLPKMNVNLLAVDEAHCISQWGYDFRPPYLEIALVRELLPNVPVMALTATATPAVVDDIQEKLGFEKPNVFQKSFERDNLAYIIREEEDKLGLLGRICTKTAGTGIVYVRNRKKTKEISDYLNKKGFSADFYHAGLNSAQRDSRQNAWMNNKVRIIVSTNAFGMGIDKPDVRFVVHMDLPESPEAYFQEAGRGGRDGKKSFAVLLFNRSDIIELERNHENSFPPIDFITKVYNSLGNFFQIPQGAGKDVSYNFNLAKFSETFSLNYILAYNSLKFLEREGYIALSDALQNPSRIYLTVGKEDLYRFQVSSISYDEFIKVLLRSYAGLFSEFVKISELDIAKRAGISAEDVVKKLSHLKRLGILEYEMQNNQPAITYLTERLDEKTLHISPEVYYDRKKFAMQRMLAMRSYVETKTGCRSTYLLEYFGEKTNHRCGQCDTCLKQKASEISEKEIEQVKNQLFQITSNQNVTTKEVLAKMNTNISEEKIIKIIKWLVDKGTINVDKATNAITWSNNN